MVHGGGKQQDVGALLRGDGERRTWNSFLFCVPLIFLTPSREERWSRSHVPTASVSCNAICVGKFFYWVSAVCTAVWYAVLSSSNRFLVNYITSNGTGSWSRIVSRDGLGMGQSWPISRYEYSYRPERQIKIMKNLDQLSESVQATPYCSFVTVAAMESFNLLMLVFWAVTLCGLVGRYQRFGGTYCLRLQGGRAETLASTSSP
jgi:hypothetical protein